MFVNLVFLDVRVRYTSVVYFDQRSGAPHAVCWSKSFVSTLKQVFIYFPITKKRKAQKITRKTCKKGVYQGSGATLKS